jgi:hypothetical protein
MTNHDKHDDRTNDPQRPSQAEGEREQDKQKLHKPGSKEQTISQGTATEERHRANDPERPSQAEGERETVDEALRKQQR